MIHYQLLCASGHGFDGWFRDSASFETQAKRGLLECPSCGSAKVERALMTPSVPRKGNARRPAPEPVPATVPGPMAPGTNAALADPPALPPAKQVSLPAEARALLQRLRAEVETSCDYVGADFAEEARRIHLGDSPQRPIYGETSPEEADALAEEGIPTTRIPWLPRADS